MITLRITKWDKPRTNRFDSHMRKRYEFALRHGERVFVQGGNGQVYEWRKWKRPAFPSLREWLDWVGDRDYVVEG